MSSKLLVASAALFAALSAQATVSVTSAAFTYGESFDSLIASGSTTFANDSTVNGWSLFRTTNPATMTLTAGTGSSNAGGFYSFGSAGSTDRALGSVGSGSTGTIAYALALTNNSGGALDSVTLRFDGEQWRNGGVASPHALLVEYGYGATYGGVTWALAGAGFNFSSIVNTSPAAAVNGNVAGLHSGLGGTIATSWAAGDTLWFRWTDVDNTGADHGLAIDNVSLSVTAVPEPGTYAMLLAGLAAVGFIARRRRA